MNSRKGKSPLLIILVISIIIFSGMGIKYLLEPLFYPLYYLQEVKKVAEEFSLDPFLLLSVIKAESNFKADAVSKAGAEGLMQLMPATTKWILLEMDLNLDPKTAVWNEELNIRMGAWFLDWLINTYYGGNLTIALAAYNAGIHNVNSWLIDGTWDGSINNIDEIPFSETKKYIINVLKNYKKYQKLYDDDIK